MIGQVKTEKVASLRNELINYLKNSLIKAKKVDRATIANDLGISLNTLKTELRHLKYYLSEQEYESLTIFYNSLSNSFRDKAYEWGGYILSSEFNKNRFNFDSWQKEKITVFILWTNILHEFKPDVYEKVSKITNIFYSEREENITK